MRKILSLVILLACLFAPVKRMDVAKLQPVQAVAIYRNGNMVALETDTGDTGLGENAEQALKDLKENALTVIYLDTAEYLLLGEDTQREVKWLRPYLRDSVRVAPYGGGKVADETAFWEVHGDLPKLDQWKQEKYDKWN